MTNASVGIILLAAGGAARMGEPKQLLALDGKPLIAHALEACLSADLGPIVVVLGASADQLAPHLTDSRLIVVRNPDWALGMSTSIRVGVEQIESYRSASPAPLTAAVIHLADLPRVTAVDLRAVATHAAVANRGIVASRYSSIGAAPSPSAALGPPVYFGHRYFAELKSLTGDQGARRVIAAHTHDVAAVDCPAAAWDIDTPADLSRAAANRKSE